MMEEDAIPITYERLYEVLRVERSRDELQELEPAFYSDVLRYLREKENMFESAQNKVDLFAVAEKDKISQQIKNVRRIVKKIYECREKKVITMALNKSRTQSAIIDTAHLLEEEKILFKALLGELDFFRQGILQNLFLLREPKVRKDMNLQEQEEEDEGEPAPQEVQKEEASSAKKGVKKVRFTAHMPQFVGEELELYGPFEADQEAELPDEVADLVVSNGSAVLV